MNRVSIMCVFLLFSSGLFAQELAALPEIKHNYLVSAHRGDHVDVPENTLAAFQMAIKHDVDFVEIDLRTTKDSVLVIMHDATVDRMTDGHGKISELSYEQLMKLKVKNKSNPAQGEYEIPTFQQVLELCKGRINIYLDYKDADVKQSVDLIKKYGMEHNIIVYINSVNQFRAWRSICPSMPLMISLPDEINTPDKLSAFLKEHPVEVLDGDYDNYTAEMIKVAKASGAMVLPDIQGADEMKHWDTALQMNFYGLQTDHPEKLIAFLKANHKR